MWQDIRVAWRFLGKARTSSALAVLTLGVAVALCSVTVGALDENLWRPLPAPGGERLVTVYNSRPSAPRFQTLSFPDYSTLRDRVQDGLDLAAFVRVFDTLRAGEFPTRVQGELVSGNYFRVLGARPFLGRLVGNEDDRGASGHDVVVLGYDFWRRSFASDPGVVGRPIRLNRHDYTVVGVAAAGFQGPAYRSQFWVPLLAASQSFGGMDVLSRADVPLLQTVGAPVAGAVLPQLRARLQVVETSASADGWRLAVLPASYLRFWPAYRQTVAQFLGIFVGLGGCVFIAAAANLAGLLLARTAERQRDLAIRQALGAAKWQLVRRLLAESLVLTALGGMLGTLLAQLAASLAEQVVLPVPVHVTLTPGLRLAAICAGVSCAASLFFTAIFAAKGIGRDMRGALAATAAAVAPGGGTQAALVVMQVGISCVCLIGAGLLVRSARAVGRVDIGFDTADTVSGLVGLDARYSAATGSALYEQLQDDLEGQPRVAAVALEWNPVLGAVRATGRFVAAGAGNVDARYNVVGPGYFAALRIPLLTGREFVRADRQGAELVAIVNERMAALIGPDVTTTRSVTFGREAAPRRIVGVVRDVKYNAITEPPQPFVYLPLAQVFRPEVWVHLRTQAPAAESLLRTRLRRLDPDAALSDVHTLSAQLEEARATPRGVGAHLQLDCRRGGVSGSGRRLRLARRVGRAATA